MRRARRSISFKTRFLKAGNVNSTSNVRGSDAACAPTQPPQQQQDPQQAQQDQLKEHEQQGSGANVTGTSNTDMAIPKTSSSRSVDVKNPAPWCDRNGRPLPWRNVAQDNQVNPCSTASSRSDTKNYDRHIAVDHKRDYENGRNIPIPHGTRNGMVDLPKFPRNSEHHLEHYNHNGSNYIYNNNCDKAIAAQNCERIGLHETLKGCERKTPPNSNGNVVMSFSEVLKGCKVNVVHQNHSGIDNEKPCCSKQIAAATVTATATATAAAAGTATATPTTNTTASVRKSMENKLQQQKYIFETANPSASQPLLASPFSFGDFQDSSDGGDSPISTVIRNPRDPPEDQAPGTNSNTSPNSSLNSNVNLFMNMMNMSSCSSKAVDGEKSQAQALVADGNPRPSLADLLRNQISNLKATQLSVNQLYIVDLFEDLLVQYHNHHAGIDDGNRIGFLENHQRNLLQPTECFEIMPSQSLEKSSSATIVASLDVGCELKEPIPTPASTLASTPMSMSTSTPTSTPTPATEKFDASSNEENKSSIAAVAPPAADKKKRRRRRKKGNQQSQSQLQSQSQTQSPSQSESQAQSPSQSESQAQSPPQSESQAQSPSQSESQPQSPSQSESQPQSPSQSESQAQSPSQSESQAQSPSQSESQAQSPSQSESQMQLVKADAEVQSNQPKPPVITPIGDKIKVEVELALNQRLYEIREVRPKDYYQKQAPQSIYFMKEIRVIDNELYDRLALETDEHANANNLSGLHQISDETTEKVDKLLNDSSQALQVNESPEELTNWIDEFTYAHIRRFLSASKGKNVVNKRNSNWRQRKSNGNNCNCNGQLEILCISEPKPHFDELELESEQPPLKLSRNARKRNAKKQAKQRYY